MSAVFYLVTGNPTSCFAPVSISALLVQFYRRDGKSVEIKKFKYLVYLNNGPWT